MNAASKKILIADDDSSVRLVLSQAFTRLGYQVRATGNATTLLKWVTDGEGDLVVTDVMMPDENLFDVLPRIRKERPKLPIIVMSAQNTLLTAVNAADAGAFEYVSKPFDLDDVTAAARRALSRPADAEASKAQARAMRDERLPLIGRSAPMQEVYRTIARLVGADLTVLILGESGTGKELVARALHELVETAKAGRTTPADMSGGTITITNVGVFGVDAGTPILNPGEAGILAVGAVRRTPWEHQGGIALRDVLTLSLSFDHRLVDGAEAAAVRAFATDRASAATSGWPRRSRAAATRPRARTADERSPVTSSSAASPRPLRNRRMATAAGDTNSWATSESGSVCPARTAPTACRSATVPSVWPVTSAPWSLIASA